MIKELCQRMGKCEDDIIAKEKDVVSVKYNLEVLEKCFHEKEEEVGLLKASNLKIKEEMKMMKEKYQEFNHQLEIKIEDLVVKKQLLEKNVNSIENQLLVSKKQLEDQQVEITSVKQEVEDVKSNLSDNIKFHLSKPLEDLQFSTNNDVKELKAEVDNVNNQIEVIRCYLDKKTDEFHNLSSKIDATENVIKDNFSTLNDKISKGAEGVNLENDPQKEIANLKHHVNNIENILFCDSTDDSKDIIMKWKFQNYQYHFDIGKPVFSPIFLTQIKGYCFTLFVEWSGEKKENLGLFYCICRGSNYDIPLEPFRMPFSLEMVDNNGNILSKKISLSEIETHREEAFTIPPGKNECKHGRGFSQFLRMPDLNNYILNDMLSIQCRLTPLEMKY